MALQRVETDAIQDDAVTTAKIAANAVAAADIAADAITNVKVAAGAAIAVAKISGLGTAATLTAGTAANNVVQLDGSARLPAISGANLTGVSTDTSAMENNIAILAFKTQSANNLAKFNLVDQVIDEYKDGTGATYSTAAQVGSTATDGYLASVYTSSTTITPSSASDYTGETGSATIGSGTVEWNVGDDSMRSTNSITGDFEFTGKCTADSSQGGGWLGVFPVSEVGTFSSSAEHGAMNSMTNSYFLAWTSRAGVTNGTNKGGSVQTNFNPVVNDVFKLTRVGSEIKYYVNDVLKTTLTSQTTAAMYICIGGTGAPGGTDYTLLSWTTTSSSDNATGTAISTANTALTAPTTGDICMLIENVAGTATLNTDLKAYVSRNGGTGWDQATLVDKGSWGTNKKIVSANNVAFSNSASGTDMRYKIEWANQASGSKETRVHATSLAWA